MNSLRLPKGKRSYDLSTVGPQPQYQFLAADELSEVEPGQVIPAHKRRYVFTLALSNTFNFSNAPIAANSGAPMEATMNGNLTIDPRLTQCEPVPSGQQMGESFSLDPRLTQCESVHSADNVTVDPGLSQCEPARSGQTTGDNVTPDPQIAGYPFEKAGLTISDVKSKADYKKIIASIDYELARQEVNPPVLPPSQLKEMAAKPLPEAPYEIPEDDPRLAEILRAKNKQILEKGKILDKDRNHLMAKATREHRNEVIDQSRRLLNDREAKLIWWKLRAIILRDQPNEFGNRPEALKNAILSIVEQRVSEGDQKRSEDSTENKSQRQSTRTTKSNQHLVMEHFQQQFSQQPGQVAAAG
ncbi:hypothetical protein B0J15DRAFT_518088 [Fusarium solani]|uniref:Uncharacterized protein n=1 Tax=Fusarium solani TaxID=169388 RepID=A0A9P9G1I3_FUSSL|nr:uncharacterized protein B0J15DRAFT_518088 [Fusarium solani]KAH7230766.1 hypothetical protein B0J15DRAFT_518088 [Fusarium solani]